MFIRISTEGLRSFITLIPFLLTVNIYSQVYLDSTASVDERVNDLLGRMTLKEKVGQMTKLISAM